METPLFTYALRGNQWAVLKWQYLPNGKSGTTIKYYPNKELAQLVARKLNIMALQEANLTLDH